MTKQEPVTVEQGDRHLFKMIVTGMVGPTKHLAIDRGGFDKDERMRYIASHRLAATKDARTALFATAEACAEHAKARYAAEERVRVLEEALERIKGLDSCIIAPANRKRVVEEGPYARIARAALASKP